MSDERPLTDPSDVLAALGLLTRIPVRLPEGGGRGGDAAWAWPLVGALVGFLGGLAGWLALALGFLPAFAAAITMVCMALLTGAMHEDGLSDSADGLMGGADSAQALEIMKDSRIGSFGALALVLVTLARWSAISTLFASGNEIFALVVAGAVGRAPMAAVALLLEPARKSGLSAATGQPRAETVWLALGIAFGCAFLLEGFTAFPIALAALAVVVPVGLAAQARIGGQTGDVLGACALLAEVAALSVMAAAI